MAIADERPLRADARRNREAILKAAKQVFATHGSDAQMDDVARRAKLGVGTLYRHFPTKDALVRALMADRMQQIADFCREGLEDPDPWNGLKTSLLRGAELAARDRALSGLFVERPDDMAATHSAESEMFELTAELIRRAQESGQMRPDVTVDDIPIVMCGVMSAMHRMPRERCAAGAWRRHLQLTLDGMQADAASAPLPSCPG